MIKKALSLVAVLGALAGGCDDYRKPEVQAGCKVDGSDAQVLYIKNDGPYGWNEDLRSVQVLKDGKLLSKKGKFGKCDDLQINCDDGSSIYVKNCVLYHPPKREKIRF